MYGVSNDPGYHKDLCGSVVEDRSTNRFPVGDSLCHARDKMKSVCFKLTFQLIYKEKSALRCQIYQSTAGIGQAALSLKEVFK